MDKRLKEISKTISYALRHRPEEFGVELDKYGWADIEDFCNKLEIKRADIEQIIQESNKARFEIENNKIRAAYGHSLSWIEKEVVIPPDILYHGTSVKAFNLIKTEGIKHMDRQRVHLSEETETAINVARRKGKNIVIIKVDAKQAYKEGIYFFKGNDTTWMSGNIPPKYFIDVEYK